MGSPLQIVVKIAGQVIFRQFIAQGFQEAVDRVPVEVVIGHQHVGLLGHLVFIGRFAFSLQEAVHTVDVTVFVAVMVPVQLLQVEIPFVLGDDALPGDLQVEVMDHLFPSADFRRLQAGLFHQLFKPFTAHSADDAHGLSDHPRTHQVGVGIVPEAALFAAGVFFVELIGPHHTFNAVASACRFFCGFADPEAADVDEQLGAILFHECHIAGIMLVLYGVIGNGKAYMPLQCAVVLTPFAGYGIEVDHLGFLPSVAATLPGEHRPFLTMCRCVLPGCFQPVVAVHQHRLRRIGEVHVVERQDVDLVPEDMSAVRFTMKPPCRDAGIDAGVVGRDAHHQVVDVQPEELLRQPVALKLDVGLVPDIFPGSFRTFHKDVKVGSACGSIHGSRQAVINPLVVGAVKRCGLVQGEGLVFLNFCRDHRDRLSLCREMLIVGFNGLLILVGRDPCCRSYTDARLCRPDLYVLHHAFRPFLQCFKVTLVQGAVAFHPVVDMVAGQCRPDLYLSRIVQRGHRIADAGQVRVVHTGITPAVDECLTAVLVAYHHPPAEDALVHVKPSPDRDDLGPVGVEPLASCRPEGDRKPVDGIHKVFILHNAAGHFRFEPVVKPGHIGCRIMVFAGNALFHRPACAEIAVANGQQRLPGLFAGRIIAIVYQVEVVVRELIVEPFSKGFIADLLQVVHHDIGSAGVKFLFIAFPGYAEHQAKVAFPGSLHARHGIFHHNGPVVRNPHAVGSGGKNVGFGFAAEAKLCRYNPVDTGLHQFQ